MMIGANAKGHEGWRRYRCAICSTTLLVGDTTIYICPKCGQIRGSRFCTACARITHYRCPYCGSELRIYI
ncbi:MAG: hypothetical protein ACO2O0_02950 [Desulfurococcales archaeon]|nr:hypothetical protein [Desulfurococcales archaeon]